MRSISRVMLLAAVGGATLTGNARPQGRGDFLAFESPQVKPIAVARIAGHDYLLVCNTPDNAVEIWDTVGLRFLLRVPVGLDPVSVVWSPVLSRFFTANMAGDSISVVRLADEAGRVAAHFERTEWVGDEPMMVVMAPDHRSLFVTHQSRSAVGWRRAPDLAPVVPGVSERIDLVDDLGRPAHALKDPRMLAWLGTTLLALGHRGNGTLDLWGLDFAAGRVLAMGGLGTTNSGLAVARNGDVYVAGTVARNQPIGNAAVAAAPTGFVQSVLHRIRNVATAPKVVTRDLHAGADGQAVGRNRALAHPTDVVLWEPAGAVAKAFLAAFHSDRVGVVELAEDVDDAADWPVRTIEIPVTPGSRSRMAGPRGLALKEAIPGLPGDPGARLYVLNCLDATLAAVDPVTEQLLQVAPLRHDPTPAHIHAGRRFLYSARLSGSGFVACASCHVDARADGLAWDLSDGPTTPPIPIRPKYIDGITDNAVRAMVNYPAVKGRMMTRSLQGLVNSETEHGQGYFTNQWYHWRADALFEDFNAAYVELMGAAAVGPRQGIPAADMAALEVFVRAIAYPPNPEQPLDRVYSGSFGDPAREDGSGALLGLKLFHTRRLVDPTTGQADPVFAGRACVHCHFLPEGSNNRLPLLDPDSGQPLESAALRGLWQKEARLEPDAGARSQAVSARCGLGHLGAGTSINQYLQARFGRFFPGSERSKLDAIARFVRELDSGVAPLVGVPLTVDLATAAAAARTLDLFEGQAARAHVGLSVHAWLAGSPRGFWFAPAAGQYCEEPGGAVLLRSALLALLTGPADRLVFQCTPLGSERRIAAPSGRATVRAGPAPSQVRLLPMPPGPAWQEVPRLLRNWLPGPASDPDAFAWTGRYSGTNDPVPTPLHARTVRLYQYGLLQDGPEFGLTRLSHDAPRRFRVAGRDIRPGSKLVLLVIADNLPPPLLPPRISERIDLPLHPTAAMTPEGLPIFETAVEAEPAVVYGLLLGGPWAPGVFNAYAYPTITEPPPPGMFQPRTWNLHCFAVLNEDGTATGGWQSLSLAR